MLKRSHSGFSLVELMIALALGTTVLAGGVGLLVSTLGFSRDLLLRTRSQQDLRLLLDLSLRDLARAGGWRLAGVAAAVSQTNDLLLGAQSGVFIATAVRPGTRTAAGVFTAPLDSRVLAGRRLLIWVENTAGNAERYELSIVTRPNSSDLSVDAGSAVLPVDRVAAGSWALRSPFGGVQLETASCLVFGYDEDGDGQRGAQERYGYRFDATGLALEGVNNADRCSLGSWQNISDERVLRLSRMQIDARVNNGPLQTTQIGLALTAQARADISSEYQLQSAMRVRNDVLQ